MIGHDPASLLILLSMLLLLSLLSFHLPLLLLHWLAVAAASPALRVRLRVSLLFVLVCFLFKHLLLCFFNSSNCCKSDLCTP
jgi:hypothetical protein